MELLYTVSLILLLVLYIPCFVLKLVYLSNYSKAPFEINYTAMKVEKNILLIGLIVFIINFILIFVDCYQYAF